MTARPLLSGFCSGRPWPVALTAGATYDPHERCRLEGCTCACHAEPEPAPDGLTPAGYTPAIVDVPRVELTLDERRRVIAGHLVLHPDTILETVRSILEARLSEGTVTP